MDEEGRLTPPVGSTDHVRGAPRALVTLVEYGDFECPYCGEAYPIVQELERRIGERLKIVWRNFPLANAHPHATEAARAAESASEQERFWEMHDQLFENQDRLERRDLEGYAKEIGLDRGQFTADLDSRAIADRVRGHFRSGVQSGVNGTPTFFINGRRHEGGYSVKELLAAIDRAAASEKLGDADRQSLSR